MARRRGEPETGVSLRTSAPSGAYAAGVIGFARRQFGLLRSFLGLRRPVALVVLGLAALGLAALAVLFVYPGTLRARAAPLGPDAHNVAAAQRLRADEAVARLELLKALVQARRPPGELERHRSLIETGLETAYRHAPKSQERWVPIETALDRLVVQLGDDPEGAIETIDALIGQLASTRP